MELQPALFHFYRAGQFVVNQEDSALTFVDFAEQTLAASEPKSMARYALESLLGAVARQEVTADTLKLWIVSEFIAGKKASTIRRFFLKAHSIYKEWNSVGNTDPFDEVAPLLTELREQSPEVPARNLELVRRLVARKEQSLTASVFFYLLYLPSASLTDAISLTFSAAPQACPQIDDIVEAADHSRGRKYVFPLGQGKSRPAEIIRNLTAQLQSLLTGAGMRFPDGFSRQSITAMWIAAALHAGVTFAEIRACIGTVPQEYSALSLIDPALLSEAEHLRLICRVADAVNPSAKRWFVMKLRRGVTADAVKQRTEEFLPGRLATMDFYYPTHTEIRKDGHKRVAEEVPFLPDLLFFKTQPAKVKSLFAAIGDMAWCYKTADTAEAHYAMIPNREMLLFQRTVARFTPDIRVDLVNPAVDLRPGRRVRITGGIMEGYEGEIIDTATDPSHPLFSLALTSTLHARWQAHIDPALIQPL